MTHSSHPADAAQTPKPLIYMALTAFPARSRLASDENFRYRVTVHVAISTSSLS